MLLPTLILARRARTPPATRAAQVPVSVTMCRLGAGALSTGSNLTAWPSKETTESLRSANWQRMGI